ncbi:Ger(x)C family spore germination protein [Cohnella fermenti]|uniref:Ger(X)C family spore germination protein n=1 Tax=Cohnella fermenti TaxID=2565925 RepID=A0A4S4BPQ9_9BACL|nr:Ger(x)C family spore germination protein [Cohnella fermenti]THF76385.1 Ger(x)C family spore germination protein [Cohnella fermenti]
MSRRIAAIVCPLVTLLLLTGCWSSSEIQNVTYAKAIGLDYKNGAYHVYVQALDFSSVAKSEAQGQSTSMPGIWIGHGQGRTMNLAINNLFQTAQMHIAWGHVTAAVLSQDILDSGKIEDVLDMVNRFPESRYTTWVYGTRMPIDKLLAISSLFNMSPLDSILHNPTPSYKEDSTMPPLQAMTFIANQHERSASTYLPSLAYTDQNWNRNNEPHDLFYIEGAFFNRDDDVHGYMPKSKLTGFSFMQPEMHRAPLLLEQDGELIGTLSIGLPKIKIKPVVRGDEVRFRIKATYLAAMYEYLSPMTYDEMVGLAAQRIKEQILATYTEALKQHIDVYELEKKLYRKHPKLWRKLSNDGEISILSDSSIESLDVKVHISYNGKYKRIAGL